MKNETNTYFYIKQFTLDAPILFRLKILRRKITALL